MLVMTMIIINDNNDEETMITDLSDDDYDTYFELDLRSICVMGYLYLDTRSTKITIVEQSQHRVLDS